ncbi:hypothetical protein lerEdw1_010096 [Lerista edwardsae]|nr:hypothetical protein lerEdw1_010096 [Lerista edwardsae]
MMAVDAKGSCAVSHAPGPLERPLKTGWLKKQRSIVKNWQQRYFVLKGQYLYYYKVEEDLKPQGSVHLLGSTIQELAATSDEVGRCIFEIIPGVSAEQNRAGQDSYVLMANSQAEMEEWVTLLQRVVESPLGVVFGQQLVETMVYEQRFGQHLVPILVEKCAEFIREHGLDEEGIFRLPGQDNLVRKLRDAFDAGERPSFDPDTDVHTVASLFKLYLRELPEPVVPWAQYKDFLLCGQLLTADEIKGQQVLVRQLAALPRDNYNLLSYICRFLHEVQQNSSTNKMNVENLAMVFGVNLIRPKMQDPATIMEGTHQIQKVMTAMISDQTRLFPVSQDVAPSPPTQKSDSKKAPVPRSSVGWDAAQGSSPSRGEGRSAWQTKDDLDASSSGFVGRSDSSVDNNGESPPKNMLGTWAAQSRKRTQTLPNRKCFLNASFSKGKENVDESDIFGGDFWSSSSVGQTGAVPSAGGHRRSLSQGLTKWFSCPQTSNSNSLRGSPVEIRKDVHERTLSTISDISEKSSPPPESPSAVAVMQPPSSADEASSLQDPELLRKMIAELKKEMELQKKDYEEQIKSLEKENYDVWAKVVRLNEEIEREKNKFADLECRLQDVERSREDVEKKNKLLEDSIKSMSQAATKDK